MCRETAQCLGIWKYGRATKIIIPSEIQGAAALAAGLVESAKGDAPNA